MSAVIFFFFFLRSRPPRLIELPSDDRCTRAVASPPPKKNPTKPHRGGRDATSGTVLTGCSDRRLRLSKTRVLAPRGGRWLAGARRQGQLLSAQTDGQTDSQPPTMSAMHTAAAWLHYKGASAAAHGPPAMAALGLYFPSAFRSGAASAGTLLWHLEHFAE